MDNNKYRTIEVHDERFFPTIGKMIELDGKKYKVIDNNIKYLTTLQEIKDEKAETIKKGDFRTGTVCPYTVDGVHREWRENCHNRVIVSCTECSEQMWIE